MRIDQRQILKVKYHPPTDEEGSHESRWEVMLDGGTRDFVSKEYVVEHFGEDYCSLLEGYFGDITFQGMKK